MNVWEDSSQPGKDRPTFLPNFKVMASNGRSALSTALAIVDPFSVHRNGHMDIMAIDIARNIIVERIWREGVIVKDDRPEAEN